MWWQALEPINLIKESEYAMKSHKPYVYYLFRYKAIVFLPIKFTSVSISTY